MILVFVAIFGLINFYLLRFTVAAYPDFGWAATAVFAALFLSLFAAIFLERKRVYGASAILSWIGYSWLGISGMALLYAAVFDLLQLFLPELGDRLAFHCVAGLTLASTLYGFLSASRVSVKRVEISSPKIEAAARPITLVQISDLHLGDSSILGRTRRVVETVRRLEPDIVVSTGDLFDGFLSLMGPYVEELKRLEAPQGKFAISGNHEVYAGLEEAMDLTKAAGFRVLRQESLNTVGNLTFVGLEDPASPKAADESALLSAVDGLRFAILLKHRPEIAPESIGRFDLQLSGHTHGGQIFPFHLLTKLVYKARPGLTELTPGRYLYLSRGTGAWGPQMRFLAPPEITLITLRAC